MRFIRDIIAEKTQSAVNSGLGARRRAAGSDAAPEDMASRPHDAVGNVIPKPAAPEPREAARPAPAADFDFDDDFLEEDSFGADDRFDLTSYDEPNRLGSTEVPEPDEGEDPAEVEAASAIDTDYDELSDPEEEDFFAGVEASAEMSSAAEAAEWDVEDDAFGEDMDAAESEDFTEEAPEEDEEDATALAVSRALAEDRETPVAMPPEPEIIPARAPRPRIIRAGQDEQDQAEPESFRSSMPRDPERQMPRAAEPEPAPEETQAEELIARSPAMPVEEPAPQAAEPAAPAPEAHAAPSPAVAAPKADGSEAPVDLSAFSVDVPAPAPGRGSRRAGRVKTRLLGFSSMQEQRADPFAETKSDASQVAQFPVGWLMVVTGPGRGSAFTLFDGVSQIGRGEGQTVRLDYGDTSISRENHAAVAYDAEQRRFFLGHGGKANLVRLNNRPVLSTEELKAGDNIRIGETTLRFVALCGDNFDWADGAESDKHHASGL